MATHKNVRKGVQLLTKFRTHIPGWIANHPDVKVEKRQPGKEEANLITIGGAEAYFTSGGAVEVKMPGAMCPQPAFKPLQVLDIRDLHGDILERNHHLCRNCMTLTGTAMQKVDSGEVVADTLECSDCGRRWPKIR